MRKRPLRSPRSLRRERAAARRSRAAGLLLLAAACAGAFYILSRPEFSIAKVVVVGETPVPKEELVTEVARELSGKYLFSLPRSSILFYPRRAIEETLLRRFPLLQSADVSLHNLASLQIAVAPRRAAALWCPLMSEDAEACVVLDQTGFAFMSAPRSGTPLPLLVDEEATSSPRVGAPAILESRLHSLLGLHRHLSALGLPPTELRIRRGEAAALLARAARVLFRDEGDFAPALARLQMLLSEKDLIQRSGDGGLQVAYIDLRYGNKIYFKPR